MNRTSGEFSLGSVMSLEPIYYFEGQTSIFNSSRLLLSGDESLLTSHLIISCRAQPVSASVSQMLSC